MGKSRELHLRLLIGLALIAAVLVVYWRAPENDFLDYHDDGLYVTNNPHVTNGLGIDGIVWAFTSSYACNWHPLTWISHQTDFELYGLDPRGHHWTNLLFHMANTILLFLLLAWLTGAVWRGAFVAALFAVHPLHVESAAWIAERKDVLSTFFWLLTLWAYAGYARRPSFERYLVVALGFALGLLSKPMAIMLPFTLLLLDYWPLGRLGQAAGERGIRVQTWPKLVLEKAPLFAMSVASGAITCVVQQKGGAVGSLMNFPISVRLANAVVAYVGYIGKMFWPSRLVALYPHPENALPEWRVALSAVLLAGLTALAIRFARRAPYLAFGWLWYLVTLVPVIGLVQVGNQAMADRYTYVPLIGLFILVAWGIPDLLPGRSIPPKERRKRAEPPAVRLWRTIRTMILAVVAAMAILALMVVARKQVGFWKDSATVFRHSIAVIKNNYLAEHELGACLVKSGELDEGVKHFAEAVRIKPDWGIAHTNLAISLCWQGRYAEAWKEVHLSRKYGYAPPQGLIRALSTKMPDPGR